MRLAATALAMALALPAMAQPLTGNIAIHDPSIAVLDDGFVSFATGVERAGDGGQIRTKTSPDGLDWQESGPLPGGMPEWVSEELGLTPPNLWAPSVFEKDGVHYLYYSASSFGRNDSAIGLMTNDALDATDPTAGWEDQGMVIRSHAGDDYNAIDPARIDTGGKAWLAFGSFWDGIRMVELDPATGMALPDTELIALASRGGGAIEAPSILQHDGKFYLFVSFDRCCNGIASSYRIMVGRADAVEGPYLDRDGKPLLEGGSTELLKADGRMRGPGGQEVFMRDGQPWLAWHWYDRDQNGMPKLALSAIEFDDEGWPVIEGPAF
ncbi:arabinan endo-1,5-alpha-L-arabinosidase [Devosia sediminis]|uniref:Extracellular exo-alpha-(1->5)-L-arabinofuranosidase n=1 Tax=Devosia sediminis TaxID=2798801 RepID=A0A934J027_9HYPH|nr:arabinan endo-1,5-alpha-L-arabinosidase [Devosia sediminis]MBJ3786280.1 arabinan endo-1,5-alpha-L-arabinosidase [Devosia sediminis]